MPSERFQKLNQQKQIRILNASLDEFANTGFHGASINRIIKEAAISRGSFYTYFEDKSDLFGFILNHLQTYATDLILRAVKEADGDIFRAAANLVELGHSFRMADSDRSVRFYYMLMTDFKTLECIKSLSFMDEMLDEIYENMNDLKNHLSRSNFNHVADMMITISIKALVAASKLPDLKPEIFGTLAYQYDIMEKGIRAND